MKIWSDVQEVEGVKAFVLFMNCGEKDFNCALSYDMLNTCEQAHEALSAAVHSLCFAALPSMSEKERLERTIKELEQRIEALHRMLKELG